MKQLIVAIVCVGILTGCASSKKPQAKTIHERPWIGGHFEAVPTPATVRTDARFGKFGALLTRGVEGTPLEKAGLQNSDLVLTVNGSKVRWENQIQKAVDKTGMTNATFTIYRDGQILEKTVAPGRERFEKYNSVAFALGLGTRLDFDLFPNPDFSLVALGFKHDEERLDLRDPKAKYLLALRKLEAKAPVEGDWTGLRSEEGWRFWLGPIWYDQRKMIVSQEAP